MVSFILSCTRQPIPEADQTRLESYSRLKYKSPAKVIRDITHDTLALHSRHADYHDEMRLNTAAAYALTLRYDSASAILTSVIDRTSNDLLRAVGDVDMMSLCLVTSRNKEFYDYRLDAQYRLDNVADYDDCMDEHLLWLYRTTQAKYHFASLNYFIRMRQKEEAEAEFAWIDSKLDTYSSDTTLYANYLLLHALGGMNATASTDTRTGALRQLVHLLYLSHQNGYAYYDIIASNALARYVAAGGEIKPSIFVLVTELFGHSIAHDLPTRLAAHAAATAHEYGNAYLESSALCTLSDIRLSRGDHQGALDYALQAFSLLDTYNKTINTAITDIPTTLLAAPTDSDTMPVEMALISHPHSVTVPEWMAMVRQQLSIVYGAMGQKAASDFNHNIYFDILDATRQDLRAQQEEERLVAEENMLNVLLLLTLAAILTAVTILVIYNVKSRRAHDTKVKMLSRVIDLCQKMTSAALEADFSEDSADLIRQSVDDEVYSIFPQTRQTDWTEADTSRFRGLEREMILMLQVFYRWMREQGQTVARYRDECEQLQAETGNFEYKYHQYKRSYIKRATSVSIATAISPFLNRAMHEASKLAQAEAMDTAEIHTRLEYLSELVEKIDTYNDILGRWVKISQGIVSLNVENVPLLSIFDILKGNAHAFEMKNITLDIQPIDATVRCDRTMTLFMLNTLLDNARKYTPSGGKVSLSAQTEGEVVRIAVADTGYGLSPAEVDTINNHKVYDASSIGSTNAMGNDIKQNKGFGFGLMNCKHIITTLQKSGEWARCSRFFVQSEVGKGSTFFIDLPLARRRVLTLLAILLTIFPASAQNQIKQQDTVAVITATDGFATAGSSPARAATVSHSTADSLLNETHTYLDSVCYANISGDYVQAVSYAEQAVETLNQLYRLYCPQGDELMSIRGPKMAEIGWWNEGLPLDYDIIISLRNEVTIAALSIPDRPLYRFNSEAFSRLYTLTSTDYTLEDKCKSLQQANRYKKTILILLATFMLLGLAIFFLLHYRHYLLTLFNLRQLLRLNSHVFAEPRSRMLSILRQDLSDIVSVEYIVFQSLAHSADTSEAQAIESDGNMAESSYMESLMKGAASQAKIVEDTSRTFRAYPLIVHASEGDSLIGVVGVKLVNGNTTHEEDLILNFVMQFLAFHTYFSTFKIQEMEEKLEYLRDEHARTDIEQRRVYEHSQIVDNTLSVLKHETLYYPNLLRQLIDKSRSSVDSDSLRASLRDIHETLSYYDQVFSTLHACASRQIDKSLFRRTRMNSKDMAALIQRVYASAFKCPLHEDSVRSLLTADISFTCDVDYLQLLLETILPWLASLSPTGDVEVSAVAQDDFVAFSFFVAGHQYTSDQLRTAFYVDGLQYDMRTCQFSGAALFTCREIVRIHDEHCSQRGCRVYIENVASTADIQSHDQHTSLSEAEHNDTPQPHAGSRFVFSLPLTKARQ